MWTPTIIHIIIISDNIVASKLHEFKHEFQVKSKLTIIICRYYTEMVSYIIYLVTIHVHNERTTEINIFTSYYALSINNTM